MKHFNNKEPFICLIKQSYISDVIPVVVISWNTRLTWSKEMFSRGWYSCTWENTEDWDLLMKHQSGRDDLPGEEEEVTGLRSLWVKSWLGLWAR